MSITSEIVRELLHYDPDTGILVWKERGEHLFKNSHDQMAWYTRHAGNRAGRQWVGTTGYASRRVRIFGKDYAEHRVAWLWMNDTKLPSEIDHINRDPTDNRWANLRAATHIENMRNLSLSKANTSGVVGVSWQKQRGKWQAKCQVRGKTYNLGNFDTIPEAASALSDFRASHSFSPHHGMPKRFSGT